MNTNEIKCTECGAYHGHSPLCSHNTVEELKAHLKVYYSAFQDAYDKQNRYQSHMQQKINAVIAERDKWKGKFFEVTCENNQLRKNNEMLNKQIDDLHETILINAE